jgi:hypothetical protein
MDADLEEGMKKALEIDEDVNSAKRQKEQARALYEQFYKEGKQKEVIQADALFHKVKRSLTETAKVLLCTSCVLLGVMPRIAPGGCCVIRTRK